MKNVRFIPHAANNLAERVIEEAWVLEAVQNPEHLERDPAGPRRVRAFRRIAAFGDRWLRVVYDEGDDTIEVVTAFFDRRAGRRL